MTSNSSTVDQNYISKYKATEFVFDIKRWKALLKHMENESIFINRTLTSNALDAGTANSTARLNAFKKQINTKTAILKDIESEVSQYNQSLATIEPSDSDITDSSWLEQHDFLKNRVENFCKDFNTFRLKVLKYT